MKGAPRRYDAYDVHNESSFAIIEGHSNAKVSKEERNWKG